METRVRYIVVGFFTLLCCALAIVFLLWLQNRGALQAQREVAVKFHGPTAGLRVGSPVDFNGLRVGQVARISLNQADPNSVEAVLSVDSRTPLSATTRVALGSEGLMGSVYVSLQGGSAGQPLRALPGRALPELDATSGGTVVDEARTTLNGIQSVIKDNAKPLHEIIGNIQDFSAVLAHNDKKLDDILGGLARLAGGGSAPQTPVPVFDLSAPTSVQGFAPTKSVQLIVADPTSVVAFDTQRLLSRKTDGQIVIQPSQWTDSIPKLVQKKVVQTFENTKYRFASAPSDGLNAEYQMLLEVQAFEIDEGEQMKADVKLGARLLGQNGKIIDARIVEGTAPAKSLSGADATAAMDAAFADAADQLLLWYQDASASRPH